MAPLTSSIETEAKLDTWVGFRLPPLDAVADGVSAVALPERVLDATYYDSADLRLARAGITVRHRTGEGGRDGVWTVKLPEGPAGPATSRREITMAAPGRVVPKQVGGLVRAVVRSAPLAPVARLRTRRNAVELRDADGRALAELDDDEVSVMDGARLVARFRELEVELRDAAAGALLTEVVALLCQAGAAPAGPAPKLMRALGPRSLAAPEVDIGVLASDATLGDVVRAALATSVARLVAHDPGVRLGDDAEDVHQARVAVRRLRSDLRTFRPVLDADATVALREDLAQLAADLGAVRDGDVLLERLRRQADELPDADPAVVDGLLDLLSAGRDQARAELLAVLDGEQYVALLDRLVAVAAAPPCVPAADRSAATGLTVLVRRPWSRLRAAVDKLGDDPAVEELHEVRILAKRCRYAAEAAAPVAGPPARRLARAVAGVQGVLGDLNDAVVAEDWLRGIGAALPPDQALVAGELVGLQRRAVDVGRREWRSAWTVASDKSLRAWLR